MTDYKQSVVANRSISDRILESGLGLDDMILVGHGHRAPHTGANRIEEGMRADVFEALIAAVYLLKGMDETRRIVREVLLEPTALPAEGRRIRGSQALRAEAPRRSSMLF
jgi:dsRNA-specific ribonuclease